MENEIARRMAELIDRSLLTESLYTTSVAPTKPKTLTVEDIRSMIRLTGAQPSDPSYRLAPIANPIGLTREGPNADFDWVSLRRMFYEQIYNRRYAVVSREQPYDSDEDQ